MSHTQRYHKHYRSGGHVWQGRFKSPVIQNDDHLLTVLRYIEANPLRAKRSAGPSAYPWSSYRVHGLGEPDELVDRLSDVRGAIAAAQDASAPVGREGQRRMEEHRLERIRRLKRPWPSLRRRDMGATIG